jgi:hypothetical protein
MPVRARHVDGPVVRVPASFLYAADGRAIRAIVNLYEPSTETRVGQVHVDLATLRRVWTDQDGAAAAERAIDKFVDGLKDGGVDNWLLMRVLLAWQGHPPRSRASWSKRMSELLGTVRGRPAKATAGDAADWAEVRQDFRSSRADLKALHRGFQKLARTSDRRVAVERFKRQYAADRLLVEVQGLCSTDPKKASLFARWMDATPRWSLDRLSAEYLHEIHAEYSANTILRNARQKRVK